MYFGLTQGGFTNSMYIHICRRVTSKLHMQPHRGWCIDTKKTRTLPETSIQPLKIGLFCNKRTFIWANHWFSRLVHKQKTTFANRRNLLTIRISINTHEITDHLQKMWRPIPLASTIWVSKGWSIQHLSEWSYCLKDCFLGARHVDVLSQWLCCFFTHTKMQLPS